MTKKNETNLIAQAYQHAIEKPMEPEWIVAQLATLFNESYLSTDRDGVVQEKNRLSFIQMKVLQAVADKLWDHLHNPDMQRAGWASDPNTKEPKGLQYRIERKRNYVMQMAQKGYRIEDIAPVQQTVVRMTEEYDFCEAVYMATAAMYEHATGRDYKPWEPWAYRSKSKGNIETQQPQGYDDAAAAEVQSMLAEIGVEWTPPAAANNTDGINTDPLEEAS